MSNPYMRKCPRGHPVSGEMPCDYCAQEDKDQAARDAKLFEALARLSVSRRFELRTLLSTVLMDDEAR